MAIEEDPIKFLVLIGIFVEFSNYSNLDNRGEPDKTWGWPKNEKGC